MAGEENGLAIANRLLGPEVPEPEETAAPVTTDPAGTPEAEIVEEEPQKSTETTAAVETPAPEANAAVPAPQPTPAAGTVDPKMSGLIHDVQDERGRRQMAEQKLAEAERRILELQGGGVTTIPAPAAAAPTNDDDFELDKLPDDEILTVGQARKAFAAMSKRQQAIDAERATAAELTGDKTGEGLDYVSVTAAGEKNLTAVDRQYIVAQGVNAAKEMYRLCILRTPALSARAEERRTATLRSSILEELQKTTNTPGQPKPAAPAPATRTAPPITHRAALSYGEQLAESLLGKTESGQKEE